MEENHREAGILASTDKSGLSQQSEEDIRSQQILVEEEEETNDQSVEIVGNYHHTADVFIKSETKLVIENKVAREILTRTNRAFEETIQYEIQSLNHSFNSVLSTNEIYVLKLQNNEAELSNSHNEVETTSNIIDMMKNTIATLERKIQNLSINIKNLSADNGNNNSNVNARRRNDIEVRKERIEDMKYKLAKGASEEEARNVNREFELEEMRKTLENIKLDENLTTDGAITSLNIMKLNFEEKLCKVDEVIAKLIGDKREEKEIQHQLIEEADHEKVHLKEKLTLIQEDEENWKNQINDGIQKIRPLEVSISEINQNLVGVLEEQQVLNRKMDAIGNNNAKTLVEFQDKLNAAKNDLRFHEQKFVDKNFSLEELSRKCNCMKTIYLEKCEEKNELLKNLVESNSLQHKKRVIYFEKKSCFKNLSDQCSSLKDVNVEIAKKTQERNREIPKLNENLNKQKETINKYTSLINKLIKDLQAIVFNPNDSKNELEVFRIDFNKKSEMLDQLVITRQKFEQKTSEEKQRLIKLECELRTVKQNNSNKRFRDNLDPPDASSRGDEKKVKFSEFVSFKSTSDSLMSSSQLSKSEAQSLSQLLNCVRERNV